MKLRAVGKAMKGSSFDGFHIPNKHCLKFLELEAARKALPTIDFIEIKTASKVEVKPVFTGPFLCSPKTKLEH